MIRTFSSILLTVLIALSCKNDPPSLVSPDMNDIERAYFEDYDSPSQKWGYIDLNGDLKIENKFDDCRDFIDGLALTNLNGKWGYIDTNGKTIIEHKYLKAGSFKNELALVKDFTGNSYFINKKGEKALSLEANKITEFESGLSICMIGGMWGAYNSNGELIIKPEYQKLKVLNDQHVLAKREKEYLLLKHDGIPVNDLVFDKLYFDSDFPYVIRQKKQYFVLDKNHNKIDLAFDKLESFKGKYTLGKSGDQYQLIDIRAKQIKSLDFEKIEYAGEGKWKYKKDGKWGLLDEEGELMTEANFYLLNRYEEGFMVFGENEDSWGYLDDNGNVATKAQYPLLWDYHNGHARFISRYGFGFLDKNGEVTVSGRYYELRDYNDGLARAQLF